MQKPESLLREGQRENIEVFGFDLRGARRDVNDYWTFYLHGSNLLRIHLAALSQIVTVKLSAVRNYSPYRPTPPQFCVVRRKGHGHARSACCPESPGLHAAIGNAPHFSHTPHR